MKALVTGGGGFCGKHLTKYLSAQGLDVHTMGKRSLEGNHFLLTDVSDIDAIKNVLYDLKPDYVFHLAGVARSDLPAEYYEINTIFAAGLLHAMERAGFWKTPVLLVGTSAEYGNVARDKLPIAESEPPKPYGHYGISKLAQTHMGAAFSARGFQVVTARPFNVIGPGMPDHLSVQSFAFQLREILEGKRPPVIRTGNLQSSRDFVDVRDVVEIYWKLLQTPSAYGEVVNVCTGKATKMSGVLDLLIRISGMDVEIKVDEELYKNVDVPVHYGSVEKLEKLVGNSPETDLKATLENVLDKAGESVQ